MGLKINLANALKSLPAIQADFNKETSRDLKDAILTMVKGGTSPVKGQGRFKEYSDSYLAQMGATRTISKTGKTKLAVFEDDNQGVIGTDGQRWDKKPGKVNLTVSGTMLETFYAKIAGSKVVAGFSSKFAAYHNEGDGVPRRAILPTRPGEQFSRVIDRWLLDNASKSVARNLGGK